MKDQAIAASGMVAELRELVEAAQSWHIGRWDSVGAVTLDKAIEALPPSVGAAGPVDVLDLDEIRPLLSRALGDHEQSITDEAYSRMEPRSEGVCKIDGCPWCKLTDAWRRFAVATPARSAEPQSPSPDTETLDGQ